MGGFENLGYAANNELSPDVWEQFMLQKLDEKDKYQSERFKRYIKSVNDQKMANDKAARQQQAKDSLSLASMAFNMFGGAPKVEQTGQTWQTGDNLMYGNQLNLNQVKWPWEVQ